MNGQIIPEETEKSIEVKQENATFLVIGDKAYTSEIIEEYNRNAEAKTEDFNTNAENKTASYNSNAADRTTAFNNNYDNKISAFNSNANKQTEEFDSHVLMQTNTFNNNAASTIANYNSNAEQKTTEFNQNALSYQEGIDANKKHIINVSNELERVKNDVLETGTDTDTYITLNDSAMAEYQELSIDGVCEQETTTGKNYFNILSAIKAGTSQSSNGITFTYNDDGTITANGTNTSGTQSSIEFTLPEEAIISTTNKKLVVTLDGGSISGGFAFVLRDNSYNNIKLIETSNLGTKFANLDNDKLIVKPRFYTYTDTTLINVKIKIMVIDKDITDYTYEPYTGGQPSPSPDFPQKIKTIENSLKITSCNKNLIPYMEKGDINSNGEEIDSTTILRSGFIKVKPNTTYISSYNNKEQNVTYYCYDKNKQKIDTSSFKSKYTTSDNVEYIRFRIYDNNYDISLFQIEQSDNFTSFEQHLETQIEANLPEGEFIGKIDDTYKDTLKVEYNEDDGQYHLNLYKNVGKVVLDGITNAFTEKSSQSGNCFIIVRDDAIKGESLNVAPYLKSTHFIPVSWNDRVDYLDNAVIFRYLSAKNYVYRFGENSDITTLDLANKYLQEQYSSNKPVIMYYPLKEEKILDLGVVDMPITYNEVTNLFTDSDLLPQINAKYYRNFISTVRNLQVNEKALKQELIDINTRLSALESTITSVASESEVVE